MASVFRKDDNFVEQPNRNTYDMSFQNNLTLNFGSLRPCFCQPVSPGDSWSIEPTFGLRFLPMVYPVQTRMKASIHYFYVRNRNLWKDWQDFIGKTKEGLVPPYINLNSNNRKLVETGQLGDFLGVPSRVYGMTAYGDYYEGFVNKFYNISLSSFTTDYATAKSAQITGQEFTPSDSYDSLFQSGTTQSGIVAYQKVFKGSDLKSGEGNYIKTFRVSLRPQSVASENATSVTSFLFDASSGKLCSWVRVNNITDSEFDLYLPMPNGAGGYPNFDESANYLLVVTPNIYLSSPTSENWFDPIMFLVLKTYDGLDASELDLSQLPWRSDANPTGIPLSALPFRAYESIYNAFYRNAENNPLLINGVPEYNKWIRTNEGGADNNFYPIMYHNWEDDFLTTAVSSPQQGNAPLVGLSGTPTLTIGHDDGSTTTAQLNVDEEGNVTAVTPMSGDEPTQQSLIEAVSYGISINDFRNVNSFQRWLENNIRRGYKYKDQIKTHYGVSVRYDELDMPEFIGGTSEPVMVNQISQTVPTDSSPLGDMAGQASAFGQGRSITHYCDEHGFIIGIICVKPVANYSQLLPKYFNVTDAFDYYFPEFGHIGMQPITYAEVTPLQANLEGKLNDVFGYQRAWYDLISKTDEVHGLFRSDFRNFLINRTFDGTPELGKEFTVMDPDQINDVFAYTENTDKILGQVFMKCSKKTPIPLYGIPKLE